MMMTFFLPHSVKEQAKILWRNRAAVGFYTTKVKGSKEEAAQGHHHFRICGRYLPASEGSLSASVILERMFRQVKYH